MITAASTSPDITSRGYELIFRTIGLDSLQGPTAGNFIADHVKPKNVDVIHDKQIGRATSELQSLMRISYAVFCLKKKNKIHNTIPYPNSTLTPSYNHTTYTP